jgi:hypothetical protein
VKVAPAYTFLVPLLSAPVQPVLRASISQVLIYYDGFADASIEGGRIDLNAEKTSFPFIANILWVPETEVLNGWLCLSVSLPYASYTKLQAGSNVLGQNLETSG